MSLIITTSAIINKLMTKPNMFPPKIFCNINHGIIITRYIIPRKIIHNKFYRFIIVFLWSSPYPKTIANLVRYKKYRYNKKNPSPKWGINFIIKYQRATCQRCRPRNEWESSPRKWQDLRATTYLVAHSQHRRRLVLHLNYNESMYSQDCSSNQRAIS